MNEENRNKLVRARTLINGRHSTFSEKEEGRKLAASIISDLISYYDQVKCVEVNPWEYDSLLREMLVREGWTPPWEPAKFDHADYVIPRSNELGLPDKVFRVMYPARRKNGETTILDVANPYTTIVTTEDRLIRLVPEEE